GRMLRTLDDHLVNAIGADARPKQFVPHRAVSIVPNRWILVGNHAHLPRGRLSRMGWRIPSGVHRHRLRRHHLIASTKWASFRHPTNRGCNAFIRTAIALVGDDHPSLTYRVLAQFRHASGRKKG